MSGVSSLGGCQKLVAIADSYKEKCIADDKHPEFFRMVVTEKIATVACSNFAWMKKGEVFMQLLESVDRKTDSNNKLAAISILFGILAVGNDFADKFMEDKSLQAFVDDEHLCERSDLAYVHNYRQNYLNTCVVVSEFTEITLLLGGNAQLLSFFVHMYMQKLENFSTETKENKDWEKPAFRNFGWLKAPTIRQEYDRKLAQAKKTITDVTTLLAKDIPLKKVNEREHKCRCELLRAFERLSSVRQEKPDQITPPILLSRRYFGSYVLSCLFALISIFLLKIITVFFAVSSLSLKERCSGFESAVTALGYEPSNTRNAIDRESELEDVRKEAKKSVGVTASRAIFTGLHAIFVRPIKDGDGISLVIHDPLKSGTSILQKST